MSVALLFFCSSAASAADEGASSSTLVLAVVETAEPGYDALTVRPLARAMEEAAPGTLVEVVHLSSATFEDTVLQLKPDLLLAPAADFLRVVDRIGAHPIGTRKTRYARHPLKSAGAAVIALTNREDLAALPALRGLSAASTLPTSLDGMLALRMELMKRGFDDRKFFSRVRYLGYSMPNVIEAVLSGSFDAGVVPVCTLERLEATGLIEPGILRVLSPKETEDSACAATTDLYPDLVAAALPWTDPEFSRRATIALLTPHSSEEYAWYGMSDFHDVRALEEALHIGPWAYLEDMTAAGIWRRWKYVILGIFGGLAFLLANEWRLRKLVARRTSQLKKTLEERDRLAVRERAARDRLAGLERMGAISQLCAMIAHELKQPVGAVINYVTVLKLRLGIAAAPIPGAGSTEPDKPADPMVLRALSGAEDQARRIAAIVDRVRGYARRQHAEAVPVDVVEEARAARRSLAEKLRPFVSLREPFGLGLKPEKLIVNGDPLEMELLLLNVIKNAAEAVCSLSDGAVLVKFRRIAASSARSDDAEKCDASEMSEKQKSREHGERPDEIEITVEDNGRRLSDEAFGRLQRVSESVKEEGLGLGLGIVRSLVEENGGRIAITRRDDLGGRGLRVTLRFDAAGAYPQGAGGKSSGTRTELS